VLGALATPIRIDRLPVPQPLEPEAVTTAVGVLLAGNLVAPAGSAEETDFELLQWSPHELWFHARSRQGRYDSPSGGTYWAKGRFDPLPARRQCVGGTVLGLPRPDLEAVMVRDPCLTEGLEGRRSVRG